MITALIVGFGLGVVVVVVIAAMSGDDVESQSRSQEELVDELSEVWTRWYSGTTASYEERLERTDAAGEVQYVEVVEGYRVGPDAVIVSQAAGQISGGIDGEGFSCATDPDDRSCFVDETYVAGAELETALAELDRAVLEDGTHRVSDIGDGCWRLRLIRDVVSPRWGDQADLCYDAATGVEVSSITQTELGVDTVTRTVRATDVTIEDLRELID